MEYKPRHDCDSFFIGRGVLNPCHITKWAFDRLCDADEFAEPPRRSTFGDGPGEPYNPNRQAYGVLKNGVGVFCELTPERQSEGADAIPVGNGGAT